MQSHPENKLDISANECCCGCLSLHCGVCPFRIVKTSPSPGSTDLRTVVQIRHTQPNSSASYSDKPSMRHPVPPQHLHEGQPQDANVKPQGLKNRSQRPPHSTNTQLFTRSVPFDRFQQSLSHRIRRGPIQVVAYRAPVHHQRTKQPIHCHALAGQNSGYTQTTFWDR